MFFLFIIDQCFDYQTIVVDQLPHFQDSERLPEALLRGRQVVLLDLTFLCHLV